MATPIEVLKFTASYCTTCKMQAQVLERLKPAFPHITITEVSIDTEAGQDIAREFGINQLPVLATRTGHRLNGGQPESQLRSWLAGLAE